MAEENQGKSLQNFTKQRFQEEVARELGIDLSGSVQKKKQIQRLEQDLHTGGEGDA